MDLLKITCPACGAFIAKVKQVLDSGAVIVCDVEVYYLYEIGKCRRCKESFVKDKKLHSTRGWI
jgi:hypothetical protein